MEIDDLDYEYYGNQLINVTDSTAYSKGFNDGNKHNQTKLMDFEYDAYGNMVKDRNKGITEIIYNHLNLPKKITFENNQSIEYIYGADGSKLRKKVTDGTKNKTVDYLSGYQYTNEILDFFPTAEGYVRGIPTDIGGGTSTYSFHYIYNYTDHLGNIRLKYTADPQMGNIQIMEENHYYPFGLEHQGYNPEHKIITIGEPGGNAILIPITPDLTDPYRFKYQGQERQDKFGLNWDSFKYRNYMPDLGRFFNVDPLAEDYVYNSTYAFAENRVLDGIELEGLEWKSVKDEETGNTNITLTIQLQDNSGLNKKQLAKVKENFQEQFSKSFSGEGVTGELIIEDVVDSKDDFLVTLTDQQPNTVYDDEGNIVGEKYSGGKTPTDGSTQKNSFEVTAKIDGKRRGYSEMSRSFSHEAGHSADLLHPWDSGNTVTDIQQGSSTVKNRTVRQNLMNSDQNPSSTNKGTSGRALTNGQLKSIDKLIREQQ